MNILIHRSIGFFIIFAGAAFLSFSPYIYAIWKYNGDVKWWVCGLIFSAIIMELIGAGIVKYWQIRNPRFIALVSLVIIPIIYFATILFWFEIIITTKYMHWKDLLPTNEMLLWPIFSINYVGFVANMMFHGSLCIVYIVSVVRVLMDRATWPFSEKTNNWLKIYGVTHRFLITEENIDIRHIGFDGICNSKITNKTINSCEMILFMDSIPDGDHYLELIYRLRKKFYSPVRIKNRLLPVSHDQIAVLNGKFGPIKKKLIQFRKR